MTALYLLTSHQRRSLWWRLPAGLALASLLVTAHVVVAVTVAGYGRYDLAHTSIWWAAACFAGERTRLRREQIRELELRAVRERQLAATEERARIARDLHDEAGHAINVIAILAGAARLRHGGDPGRSLAALAEIEDLARTTAEEIDRFVGGLRRYPTDEEPILAPHGVVSIPSLVEHHQHAGLRIRCRTVGVTRPLPPAVDHAAYRIVQEALTNASRYGRGSAELRLDYGEAELELTVTNDVRPGAEPPARGRGHGLIGAGERVGRLGGTLVIERSDHLHVLQARLPYHCGPAACPGS
jgi:signal transduction histidine kinase